MLNPLKLISDWLRRPTALMIETYSTGYVIRQGDNATKIKSEGAFQVEIYNNCPFDIKVKINGAPITLLNINTPVTNADVQTRLILPGNPFFRREETYEITSEDGALSGTIQVIFHRVVPNPERQ